MHRALAGGHVQRAQAARVGGRDVVLLHVRSPGETRFVVAAAGLGVGVLDAPGRDRLREAMRAGAPGDRASWERVVEAAGGDPDEDLDAAGARIVEALASEGSRARLEALRRALARALARIDRRIEAVRGDLERAAGADETARRAQLFVAEAARAQRGATKLVAVDWSLGEPREIEMKLDPAKGARAQLDAVFQRARRLKEGARIGRTRLAEAEKARAALAGIAGQLGQQVPEELAPLEARARAAAPRDFKMSAPQQQSGGSRPTQQAPLPPYRTFASALGARILVGKGAEKNDELTFHLAKPHDLWLHAKNRAGAHVIVPLARGHSCPAELLVEAAHLAAHFSEARDEDVVEVQYALKRHLRKPRGSAPGLVVVDREKVLVLRRQPELLERLLQRESE
jgi:predicted ribosome quality control (RQC) complex YloA/Tae2 family protein